MSKDTEATEFEVGEQAVIYRRPTFGTVTASAVTIERLTKTQYILNTGQRFRRQDRREVGGGFYDSPELIRADDPRVAQAAKEQRRARLVGSLHAAIDDWQRDRRVTPSALATSAQALVDFDAKESR